MEKHNTLADIVSLYDLSATIDAPGTLFDLVGVKKVMISSIQFMSVSGSPNMFDITINMVQNDINIYDRERLLNQAVGGCTENCFSETSGIFLSLSARPATISLTAKKNGWPNLGYILRSSFFARRLP